MAILLELRTFGGLTIKRDEVPIEEALAYKARALLVYLACDRRPHRRELVANLLWDNGTDHQLMSNLRVLLSGLRREMAPFVTITRETVAFNFDSPHWLDVTAVEEGLMTARTRWETLGTLPPKALTDLSQTLQLYHGDFLEGFHLRDGHGFDDWMLMQQEHWRLEILEALKGLVTGALAQGEYRLGLEHVRHWLELDPLTEAAHRQAMELYARTGHWDSALQQYEQCSQILDDELGIEPGAETKQLYQAIRTKTLPPAGEQSDEAGVRLADRVWEISRTMIGQSASLAIPPAVFVGRERQLEELVKALAKARSGSGQIRFVIGGGGRGKSMLVQEFSRLAARKDPSLLVVCGHGYDQTGQGDPYMPWREVLAMLSGEVETGLSSGPIPEWQAQHLRAALPVTIPALVAHAPALIDSFIPAEALRRRAAAIAPAGSGWFERLSALTARGARSGLVQKAVFSQVTSLLKTVSGQQPLLLVLEDLHWADPASCGLLFHLSRHLGGSPILLLCTYRPEELVREIGRERHPLARVVDELKRQVGNIWLDLGQLGEAEDRQFVTDYLDSQANRLDETFREGLFRQTGGHPLFTVELVQAMQKRGELVQDESGRWLAVETIDWQALPVRVEGAIESRINRLDKTLQRTLTVASIEGERFTAEVVARVQGLSQLAVVQQLGHELERRQRLISAQGVKRLGPGGQRLSRYRFRHHLFQQYLYRRLDESERTYLHEAVATILETLHTDHTDLIAFQLAHHFQKAGIADKAVDYLLSAGKQAVRLGAYTEAVAHLTGALELLATMPVSPERTRKELDLQLTLGHALVATQGYATPAVEAAFGRARMLCSRLDAPAQGLPVLYATIVFYLMRADLPLAQHLGEQFLLQARRRADSAALLVGHRALGTILLYSGQLLDARRHLEKGISQDNLARHRIVAAEYFQSSSATGLISYAFTLCLLGYPDQARQQVEDALRLAEAETYPIINAQILSIAAMIHGYLRDLAAAQRCAEAAIALTGHYEIIFWEVVNRILLYGARARQGAAGFELVAHLRRALGRYKATGARLGLPYLLSLLAESLARLEQPELAEAQLEEALAISEESGHRLFEPELYRLQGELLACQNVPASETEAYFERAIELARQNEARWFELRATTSLARLWQAQGKQAEAYHLLVELYDWFSEGFDTADLVEARNLLDSLRESLARGIPDAVESVSFAR